MERIFKVLNLDCAHCANKMEGAISKIDGVNNVSVNFLAQKIVLEYEENKQESIIEKMLAICKKIEPDCIIKI